MNKIVFITVILLFSSFLGITPLNRICLAQEEYVDFDNLLPLGMEAYKKGDIQTALNYFKRRLAISRMVNNNMEISRSLFVIAELKKEQGEYKEALEYLNEMLKIGRETNDTKAIIYTLWSGGSIYAELGEYNKSLEYLNEALNISKAIDDKENTASMLIRIGGTHSRFGYLNKALEYLDSGLRLSEETNYNAGRIEVFPEIGAVYFKLGELNKALEYFERLLTLSSSMDYKLGAADANGNLGLVYFALGNLSKSLKCLDDSLKIYREAEFKRGIATALMNKGTIYLKTREFYKALDCFNESMYICIDIKDKLGYAANVTNIGSTYYFLGEFNNAFSSYVDALNIYTGFEYKEGAAHNFGNIAKICYRMNNFTASLKYAKNAFIIANEIKNGQLLWQASFFLGALSEKTGDNTSALSYYKTSIDIIESIRGGLRLEEHKLSFVEDKMDVYKNIVLLLLKLGKKEEAFDYVERAKSRALLDLLGNKVKPKEAAKELSQEERGLENRINALLEQATKESSKPKEQQRGSAITQNTQELQKLRTRHQEVINGIKQKDPEFASFLNVEPLKSAEVSNLLDKDTTLLEYYVTENRLLIWIINNGKLNTLEVSVKETELTAAVAALRTSIENRSDNYREISRKLYKFLIEPAKPYINTTRLCIVPHKALHYLSFSALLNNDKFLIEDYTIFYSPNASLLKFCFDKRKAAINNLLAFGNPDNSLENSEIEVSRIKKDFPKSDVFIREAATESKAKELTDNYDIVHFACHGELNPVNPLYSHLKLAKDSQQDGRLEVWEIYEMDLSNTSLVTLSACQTALGNITNGDEIIGLTRGFIYAGSPSIVASLWDIDDTSTSILMQEFYSELKQNHPKVESLRLAQLKLIKDKTKGATRERGIKLVEKPKGNLTDHSHPYYWAAFELIGDWK